MALINSLINVKFIQAFRREAWVSELISQTITFVFLNLTFAGCPKHLALYQIKLIFVNVNTKRNFKMIVLILFTN